MGKKSKQKSQKNFDFSKFGFTDILYFSFEDELKKVIDREIKIISSSGKSIYASIPYLESIINEFTSEKLGEIEKIHQKNRIAINEYFKEREAVLCDYKKLITNTERQIEDTAAELENIKVLYEKYNPLQKISGLGGKNDE